MVDLGAWGVGFLTLLETIVPPIPSEVVLPLAGYLSQRGRMDLVQVGLAATVGSMLGAYLLYALGARLGVERSARWLARVPLVDRDDVDAAVVWFDRHGPWAVLVGRLMPGVRSLISVPAGATAMSPVAFGAFTLVGSTIWNALLVGGGYALGTRYHLVEQYAGVLDKALIGLGIVLVGVVVARRLRRRSRTAAA